MMATQMLSSQRELLSKALCAALVLVCSPGAPVRGVPTEKTEAKAAGIPPPDYVSRAKGIIRALYPNLVPPPQMRILDMRAWDDPGVVNVFGVELCGISPEQLTAEEPCPCKNPVLKAHFLFEYVGDDKELIDVYLTGPAARGREETFGELVRGHRQWSEAQVIQALKGAGAMYGPGKKEEVISALPLTQLTPYVGELKVESVRLDLKKPSNWTDKALGDWGVCAWIVAVTATAPSGNKHKYYFIVEPFGGKVISIWETVHPTSPDFPSFPPRPE
jgi:hypothetical protein